MKRSIVALVLAIAAATGLALPAASTDNTSCRDVSFAQATYTIRGTLCAPSGRKLATVLLVHGSTYDRHYWNQTGLDPNRYSALKLLAKAGYQTVAIDRLGSGASSRLSDEAQTADASADAIHAVIRQLRRSTEFRTVSSKLFVIGHSSGSTLAIREAAAYDDVDGLVLTGLFHTPGIGADLFLPMLYPASDDPKFQGGPQIPAGYVTTIPGVRVLWYDIYGPNADPAVLRYDEAQLKDAMPQADSGGFVDEVFVQPRSPQIHKPVLVVVGNHDSSNCDPPDCRPNATAESSFWPQSSDVQVKLVRNVGHVLNLHTNARQTTDTIRRWIDRHDATIR